MRPSSATIGTILGPVVGAADDLARLDAGAANTELRFDTMDRDRWPYTGVATLTGQLKDAGLNEDYG